MRRVLIAVLGALFLLTVPVYAVAAAPERCTRGDAQRLVHAGQIAARQFFSETTTHPAEVWQNCQFRLYDETPRVFKTKDYFVAGIFLFESYDFLDRPDYDRADAIAALDSVTHSLYWGSVSVPDDSLPEISLTRTNYRDARLLEQFGGHVVSQHIYAWFVPGGLTPGVYHWRYEAEDPLYGDFVARGSVTIEPS